MHHRFSKETEGFQHLQDNGEVGLSVSGGQCDLVRCWVLWNWAKGCRCEQNQHIRKASGAVGVEMNS